MCALFFLAAGCSPSPSPPSMSGSAARERGASLFDGNCAACHQADGRGLPGVYPPLAGSPVVLGDPRAFDLWVVEGKRAASMTPGRYTATMPQFGWLKAADAAALLTFLRSSFGNAAPAVDAAMISGGE
jgi:mono/diheme cytochrome c family protein